jgi:hypothetical protein
MNYLTNYYKNLSEQLQVKVNALNSQLNEYLVQKGEKDGKKGVWRGSKFTPDEENKFDPERKEWLDSQMVKPKTQRGDIGEPDYSKYKVNIDDVTREFRKRSNKLDSIKPENTETDEDIIQMRQNAVNQGGIPQDMVNEPLPGFNFKKGLAFPVFKEKQNSPNLKNYGNPPIIQKYGNPDEIDILPQERNDMISSTDKLKKPFFDNKKFY